MTVHRKAIEIRETEPGAILYITLTGKLTSEDYEEFVPEIDKLVQAHGKISIVVELVDFHGWNAGALWQDTKFAVKHFNDIERLAIVGDTKWQQGMAYFCKPFTAAKIRYFDLSQSEEAKHWIATS